MGTPITVGVIGATGKTGRSVVDGLLSSPTKFTVTSFTREASVDSQANKPSNQKIPWIEAAKEAGVKRSVPSEWVGPAPRGIIDIKDKKLDIPGVIQRVGLPYTLIDVGCWFQVWVPKISSGRSDHAHSIYIDHRIVGDGNQKFGLTDMGDIGKRVFAYTEVLSMNEIWDTMATVSGEIPPKDYVSEEDLREIIESCGKRWHEHGAKVDIMDVANYNMGQYRISWCIRGDNTPEFADYLGYLDFWKLFPDFPKVRSLKAFYQQVVTGACAGYGPATSE
ncbi:NAD(P)-binding protein [Aspergillus phoenicis ATCC 13157]|uniref:NAD(P)-binding protein n=1 Tax=Aspergillus phoenicis ATCC 13157 TaxID=1353007 RepID=A0A370PJI4_ASPPH|nr:NAD(P)-binding protein [Aspergillus phoenicis ATCC 13157]